MFAVCMVFAAGTAGDHWIASGTHPVYGAKVRPIPLGGERPLVSHLEMMDAPAVVTECASKRNLIATLDDWLVKETTKASPEAEMVEKVQAIRAKLVEELSRHADMLARHPELDQRIEDERLRLKSKRE